MQYKIIMISGKQGSGKSSLAKAIQEKFEVKHNCDPIILSFAYHLKQIVKKVLNELNIKTGKNKSIYQALGKLGRDYDEFVWINKLKEDINQIREKSEKPILFIIDDLRFQNEFEAFNTALKIRLICDIEVRKTRCEDWRSDYNHISEIDLDEYSERKLFNMYFDSEKNSTNEILELIEKEIIRIEYQNFSNI